MQLFNCQFIDYNLITCTQVIMRQWWIFPLEPYQPKEILVYVKRWKHYDLSFSFTLHSDHIIIAKHAVSRSRDFTYTCLCPDIIVEGRVVFEISPNRYHDHILTIDTYISMPEKVQLPVYDYSANDQRNRYRELERRKYFTDHDAAL